MSEPKIEKNVNEKPAWVEYILRFRVTDLE
jgi:hypothetical protein